MLPVHKKKIINDPVHGFITIPNVLAYTIVEHPYFQRLRNIKQLGLTNLVYPGACHNRFQHALGAMHLMEQAIEVLRSKGHVITDEEAEAAICAILLHDIGHGPFSHALEFSIVDAIHHEEISSVIIEEINREFGGKLDLAIEIFHNRYHKKFLHQLLSGELDVDRLDYLRRDSFFSGVAEGMIGVERIIKMLNVCGDELVIESKGIYSIEKFLISRHLMYWQVYLHKTVVAAEQLLLQILKRAKELARMGEQLFASPSLQFFLKYTVDKSNFRDSVEGHCPLENFALLSDSDIESAIKVWAVHPDKVLSTLCKMLTQRKLFRVEMSTEQFNQKRLYEVIESTINLGYSPEEINYFVINDCVSNKAYNRGDTSIKIQNKYGELTDISEVSDMLNASAFSTVTRKYILCYPKEKRL